MRNRVLAVLEKIETGADISGDVVVQEIKSEILCNSVAAGRTLQQYEKRQIAATVLDWHDRQTQEWSPLEALQAKQDAEFWASTVGSPDIAYAFEHPAHV